MLCCGSRWLAARKQCYTKILAKHRMLFLKCGLQLHEFGIVFAACCLQRGIMLGL